MTESTEMVLASDVAELSEEQRAGVLAFFDQNPDGGYKAALHSVGVRATKAEARALLHSDDEIRNARFAALGLDEKSAFAAIGEIIGNADHKDRLRAATFAVNALHGWHENATVEHVGEGGGPVVMAHERRLTLDDLVSFARTVSGSIGGASGELPGPPALLPAPPDD